MKINLKQLSFDELEKYLASIGMKRYKTDQLLRWIYKRGTSNLEDMTDFSKSERGLLSKSVYISSLELTQTLSSNDGTKKFLHRLEDGNFIESVLIPDKERVTLCISTQAGCALACSFCQTGKIGFIRNLEAFEIADQIISAKKLAANPITNIVMMGMGEPLMNFKNVMEAINRINHKKGMEISLRTLTISTAGIIPHIIDLGELANQINLAVSLNASTDEIRNKLMPINKKYPLADLISACRQYPLPPKKKITFEYILIKDINDSPDDAQRLVTMLKGIQCKINLIPFNSLNEINFARPKEKVILKFQEILINGNIPSFIRKSKGQDISGACGQLGYQAQKPETLPEIIR